MAAAQQRPQQQRARRSSGRRLQQPESSCKPRAHCPARPCLLVVSDPTHRKRVEGRARSGDGVPRASATGRQAVRKREQQTSGARTEGSGERC